MCALCRIRDLRHASQISSDHNSIHASKVYQNFATRNDLVDNPHWPYSSRIRTSLRTQRDRQLDNTNLI